MSAASLGWVWWRDVFRTEVRLYYRENAHEYYSRANDLVTNDFGAVKANNCERRCRCGWFLLSATRSAWRGEDVLVRLVVAALS